VRTALAANQSIGADQAAMVRDITQGGQGVSVVVGKAGAGKTYALGVARHAWQLEGYRVLGAAPTGIATVCLDAEGFERSRTVDSLLGELDQEHADRRPRPRQRQEQLTRTSLLHKPRNGPDRLPHRAPDQGFWNARGSRIGFVQQAGTRQLLGRDRGQDGQDERVLDARTVLVVDEAGMLGSRKLARLLDHAADARAKVVLVGDDKQLASIEAGGGFRGLRLRLGASTLTHNRRQAEPWERDVLDQLRDGDIEAALVAYRAHDRTVAVETPASSSRRCLPTGGPRSSRATGC
jgi:ATP-dependent exoDNAse (exonuclease V) alpha subunit